jgi:hypothetical protein
VIAEQAFDSLGIVVRHAPHPYRTSWPLEETELIRPDGTTLRLLIKRLGGAVVGKPEFLQDPARELEAYRLLAEAGLGTPRCYASGRWWLALEKIDGTPLWQHGDLASWEAAARWARSLHGRFRRVECSAQHLLCHDESFYRRWLARARARAGRDLDPLSAATEAAITRLLALPRTLIHGELYPSNVMIDGSRVAVVDWEMAAVGPGVIDLGALVTGWDGEARRRLVSAFGGAAPRDLAAAQLLLALQWLGWSTEWQPPPEHRRDWLADARAAAELLT